MASAPKIALIFCLLSICISFCLSADAILQKEQGCTQYVKDIYGKWVDFRQRFNPHYNSTAEEKRRFGIFVENVQDIEHHNREAAEGKHTWTKGINQFADKTKEEMSRPCAIPPGQTTAPPGCVVAGYSTAEKAPRISRMCSIMDERVFLQFRQHHKFYRVLS